jgi:hypothetical protein
MAPNLITNGGFEDPANLFTENLPAGVGAPPNANKGIMELGTGDLKPWGWRVDQGPILWRRDDNRLADGTPGPHGVEGRWFLDLTYDGSSIGIIQTNVAIGTTAARRHHLSLYIGTFDPHPGMETPVIVRVTVFDENNGNYFRRDLRHDPDPSIPGPDRRWTRHEVEFIALADHAGLAIERVDNNAERAAKNIGASRFVGVDDVRVTLAAWTWLDALRAVGRWFVRLLSRFEEVFRNR